MRLLIDSVNRVVKGLASVRPGLLKSPLRLTVQSWSAVNPVCRLFFLARNVQYGLLDRATGYNQTARISTGAKLAGRSQTVRTREPENVTFPLGKLIRDLFKKPLRRFRSTSGVVGSAGCAAAKRR